MFNVNDAVLYGVHGVCRIIEIQNQNFGGKDSLYYVLKPVYNDFSTFFVPVDNENLTSKMKKVLSPQEIHNIIHSMPQEDLIWIDDDAERKEKYNEILKSGDRTGLVRIIKTLYFRQKQLKENRKKLHMADERFMKEAEKMLYEEFAYVLNIDQDQVIPFIAEEMEIKDNEYFVNAEVSQVIL